MRLTDAYNSPGYRMFPLFIHRFLLPIHFIDPQQIVILFLAQCPQACHFSQFSNIYHILSQILQLLQYPLSDRLSRWLPLFRYLLKRFPRILSIRSRFLPISLYLLIQRINDHFTLFSRCIQQPDISRIGNVCRCAGRIH